MAQFSTSSLMSAMRESNYLSSPSFDRGMESGPNRIPIMGVSPPDPTDVNDVLQGKMPQYRNMSQSIMGLDRSPFFSRHPLMSKMLEGGVMGAALTQQGETTGENISNVAHSILGIPQLHRAYMYSQLSAPFEQADKIATIQDKLAMVPLRQAMMERYAGMADYYNGKNDTAENIERMKREGQFKNSLLRANSMLGVHGQQLVEDSNQPGGFDVAPIPGWQPPPGPDKGYPPSKVVEDQLSPDPKVRARGKMAENIYAHMAGSKAESVAGAGERVRNPIAIQKDSTTQYEKQDALYDKAIRDLESKIANPKAFPKGTDPKTIETYRAQWNEQLKQMQFQQSTMSSAYDQWKREFNPADPYHFAPYFNDYLNDMKAKASQGNVQAPPPPSAQKGSQSQAPKGQWNPVAGRYE